MNDPIEVRLAHMKPAAASPVLMQRLREPRPPVIRFPQWVAWAAAAAVIVLTFVLWPKTKSPLPIAATPVPARIFTPVESHDYLVEAREFGILSAQPNHPVQLIRCVWIEDDTYRAADGISTMHVTHARDEIVPVALKIY